MNVRGIALASALSLLPMAGAHAQAVTGLYYSMGVGINIMQNESATISSGGYSTSGNLQPNPDVAGLINVGWGFGNGLRAEGELSYRGNTTATDGGLATTHEQKAGLMMNVLYDFTAVPVVKPYLGAGIGFQEQWLDASVSSAAIPGAMAIAGGGATSFAYQAIAGVAMPITSMPGVDLTLEYHYMGMAGHRTHDGTVIVPGVGSGTWSLDSNSNDNHTILLGVRYSFGPTTAR